MNKEILEFAICKKLYDAGVRVETEKVWHNLLGKWEITIKEVFAEGTPVIPALSIVDGLELMKNHNIIFEIDWYVDGQWKIEVSPFGIPYTVISFSLKDVVEKSLVYLLDNGLLGNTK